MGDDLHACPWPDCSLRVPRHLWGCKTHWYRLPRDLRKECTRAWRSGSWGEHLAALEAIDDWLDEWHGDDPAAEDPTRPRPGSTYLT